MPTRPTIFEFESYRDWLAASYRLAREEGRGGYSYRALASRAGYRSPMTIKRIIDGDRRLTPKGAARLGAALGLTRFEQRFLDCLVAAEHAETEDRRAEARGEADRRRALWASNGLPLPHVTTLSLGLEGDAVLEAKAIMLAARARLAALDESGAETLHVRIELQADA